jgi:hypothetical protein
MFANNGQAVAPKRATQGITIEPHCRNDQHLHVNHLCSHKHLEFSNLFRSAPD